MRETRQFTRSLICPSKSFHRGPSNIISSLILFNICQCRILVMIEFRRGILVDSFSSFSLPQRPKKSALVNNVQREIAKGDIGGGLVLRWRISIQKDNPKIRLILEL
ncbi:hypothetical protein POTOM_013747 [Populus tomentosa]|uniref:Uncharacterized protein n=1 Tax=Populus tomentosa TaxID=118781 RepID=A0A8X8A0T9_POPTO|nr:hypothetical protein POTOM_013747 [Populus tomentosa]